MAGAEHTPGPWHILSGGKNKMNGILTEDLNVIAYVGCKGLPNRANSCLIAAAPCMFDYIKAREMQGDPEAVAILKEIARGWPKFPEATGA